MLSLISEKRLQSEIIKLNNMQANKNEETVNQIIFETKHNFRYICVPVTVFPSVSLKIITTNKKTGPIVSQPNLYSVEWLTLFTGNLKVCFYG